jgi:hypothetical protein
METIFPTEPGYEGFFLVGWRKQPGTATTIQQVGAVLLKRSYAISPQANPALGLLTPAAEPVPIFMQDVAENLVLNGDMESSQKVFGEGESETLPAAWQAAAGVTAMLAPGEGHQGSEDTGLRISGVANGRIVQAIALAEPLAGRPFAVSLHARADANTSAANIRLEAAGTEICTVSPALTTIYTRHTATGVWPATVTATEMQMVLRMATDSNRTLFYDNIEVLARDHRTRVDVAALRYESDLVPFKPEGDVVVLDYADRPGLNRLRVNGSSWLARMVTVSGGERDKALFGWEPRPVNPRQGEAAFPEDESAYPLPQALPDAFNNRFYNGYRRDARQLAALPYLPATANLVIERPGSTDYGFHLNGEVITAVYYTYSGTGPDKETYWQPQPVTMNLDTLVIEPEHNRCYAVWRGVWPFDNHAEDAYRRLVVTADQ